MVDNITYFSFVGYATGGGMGDTTPWVGLGIDDVLSYDIVLYDGTPVTASPTEHDDLYWALKGGGSGFGVITSLTTAVISAPEEASKFTWVGASYKRTQNEAREFLKRFQDFLMPDLPIGSKEYKEKVRATSAKFGGGATFSTNSYLGFDGLFLGSAEEATSTFEEAGLLDHNILSTPFDTLEFSSYADAQLTIICYALGGGPPIIGSGYFWVIWVKPGTWTPGGIDICEDLGINSDKYCYQADWGKIPKCDPSKDGFDPDDLKNEILPALKDVAIEPQSWFNRPAGGQPPFELPGLAGGLLHGRLHPDVLLEMANVGFQVNHFAHGKHSVIKMEKSYDFDSCFSDCVHLLIFTSLLLLPYSLSLFIV